jgi:release factor family 3
VITRADFDRLLRQDGGPRVSIYMPRHIGSRDTRQDPARLKNLLNTAENRLAETGVRPDEAERLLAPARALIADEAFWREQSHGLALFAGRDGVQAFNLPIEPGEHVCAGERFHLFPLLSMLEGDRQFLILTISRDNARLYGASRETIVPTDAQLPKGVQSVAARTDYDGENTPEDYRRVEVIQYLREVSKAVEDHARRERLPIVLIALAENQGHFRALGNHPDLLWFGIAENPDAMSERDLHARALDALQPLLAQADKQLVERFGSMTGGNRISTEIDEIVDAARSGRIDTLILSDACEGQLDDALLDTALTFSLRNGGQARIVPQFMMPAQAPAAAIFRY